MAWSTPKTDWDTDDGIIYTDLNRIEANTEYLYDNKLDYPTTGTHSTELRGYSSPPSIDIEYAIKAWDSSYNLVQVWFPETISINSNQSDLNLGSALPAAIRRPDTYAEFYPWDVVDSGNQSIGVLRLTPYTGAIAWGTSFSTTVNDFTSSGTKGIIAGMIQYLIPVA
jgi:hypothetical protein